MHHGMARCDRCKIRLMCVEHNIETLRTRLTQVAELRDTQGIREDHRTIVARLDEVEEYASVNTFREFMTKIQRLEAMVVSNGGGTVEEAIRVCTRRTRSATGFIG